MAVQSSGQGGAHDQGSSRHHPPGGSLGSDRDDGSGDFAGSAFQCSVLQCLGARQHQTLGTTERVSVSSDELQADGNSQDPAVRGFTASGPDITRDGRYVAFFSSATNLVPDDTNTCPPVFDEDPGRCPDVFVRDRVAGTTVRVSLNSDGAQSPDRSSDPVISDSALIVAFWSAGNLVPEDTNTCPGFIDFLGNCPDVFVRDDSV